MSEQNQNRILIVQDGLRIHFDDVCDTLSDIADTYGSFGSFIDVAHDAEISRYARLTLGTLEPDAREISARHLNAYALGHIAAQLCTRFDGTVLLINQSGGNTPAQPQDFRDMIDQHFAESSEVYALTQTFLDPDRGLSAPSTELYMAEAAMLLANLSNIKQNELDRQINTLFE